MNTDELQQEQSPYVEDKALTWKSLTRSGRIAISAGALAIGTFAVASPGSPVMAALIGAIDSGNNHLLDGADEGTNFSPVRLGPTGLGSGNLPQAPVIDVTLPNVQSVPPVSVNPNSASAGQVANSTAKTDSLLQKPVKLPSFSNVSSATPATGAGNGSASTGRTGYGDDARPERGERGERSEGSDD